MRRELFRGGKLINAEGAFQGQSQDRRGTDGRIVTPALDFHTLRMIRDIDRAGAQRATERATGRRGAEILPFRK